MASFPTVRELAVSELGGHGAEVGCHPFLERIDVFELADFPTTRDITLLCGGGLFGKQKLVRFWNAAFGSCPLFGIVPEQWKPSGVVEYVQLLGGVMAGELREGYDLEADECAAEFNAVWGEGTVRVVRPYERTYPIHEEEGSFPCGRFPDDRFGLVFFGSRDEQVSVAVFDGMRHVGTKYFAPPTMNNGDDFMKWVRAELQLSPESIRVRQFRTERMYGVQLWPEWWVAGMDQGRFSEWSRVWEWMYNGRFVIEGMGGHWADFRGFVTDS